MQILDFIRHLPDRYGRVTAGPVYSSIDGLRFIAVFVVVVGHIVARVYSYPHIREQPNWTYFYDVSLGYFLNQTAGVLLFFAISGYITNVQLRRKFRDEFSATQYSTYILGRTLRIVPPYFIIILSTYLFLKVGGYNPSLAASFNNDDTPVDSALIYSLTYSYGWIVDKWPKLFVPGWSLEIEAQFYIVAPFLVYGYFQMQRWRWLAGILLLVASVLLVASPLGIAPHWRFTLVRYFSYFWLGILAADSAEYILTRMAKWLINLLSLVATVVFLYIKEPIVPSSWGGAETYFFLYANIICIFMMLVGCQSDGTLLNIFCRNRYISFLGAACYSIYLTHPQVIYISSLVMRHAFALNDPFLIAIVNAVVQIPLIAIVSIAFYILIERTFARKEWPAYLSRKFALAKK